MSTPEPCEIPSIISWLYRHGWDREQLADVLEKSLRTLERWHSGRSIPSKKSREALLCIKRATNSRENVAKSDK